MENKTRKATMMVLLERLVDDFNKRSELVALNYEQVREGKITETTLQWNRGSLYRTEEYMIELAELIGVELEYRCEPHTFGYEDWQRGLEYLTVVLNMDR